MVAASCHHHRAALVRPDPQGMLPSLDIYIDNIQAGDGGQQQASPADEAHKAHNSSTH